MGGFAVGFFAALAFILAVAVFPWLWANGDAAQARAAGTAPWGAGTRPAGGLALAAGRQGVALCANAGLPDAGGPDGRGTAAVQAAVGRAVAAPAAAADGQLQPQAWQGKRGCACLPGGHFTGCPMGGGTAPCITGTCYWHCWPQGYEGRNAGRQDGYGQQGAGGYGYHGGHHGGHGRHHC